MDQVEKWFGHERTRSQNTSTPSSTASRQSGEDDAQIQQNNVSYNTSEQTAPQVARNPSTYFSPSTDNASSSNGQNDQTTSLVLPIRTSMPTTTRPQYAQAPYNNQTSNSLASPPPASDYQTSQAFNNSTARNPHPSQSSLGPEVPVQEFQNLQFDQHSTQATGRGTVLSQMRHLLAKIDRLQQRQNVTQDIDQFNRLGEQIQQRRERFLRMMEEDSLPGINTLLDELIRDEEVNIKQMELQQQATQDEDEFIRLGKQIQRGREWILQTQVWIEGDEPVQTNEPQRSSEPRQMTLPYRSTINSGLFENQQYYGQHPYDNWNRR